jgi:hypothetical protein
MGDDVPEAVDRAPVRRILSERNMRTPPIIMGLQEVVWVFLATSEGWKHACEHLEPQIFLVA